MDLRSGERLDDLGHTGLKLIQSRAWVPFAIDSVLLCRFVRLRRGDRLLDLGTGTGVIPLLLSALHPAAELHGLEMQPELADMAARSVAYNGLTGRVQIREGDWRRVAALYGDSAFSAVTLNPPYRRPGTGRLSPVPQRARARHALDGTLAEAVAAAGVSLKHGGRLFTVFLAERLGELLTGLAAQRLEPKRLRPVYPAPGRQARLVLVEAAKGGRPGLHLEPPLCIYREAGTYSDEVAAYFAAGGAAP